jgi:hypothetical protein
MRFAALRIAAFMFVAAGMTACVYDPYYPYGHPYTVPGAPASFDRSWNAAMLALQDQGVRITAEDRGAGVIEGQRGAMTVRTRLNRQADGGVRVEFNVGGNLDEDRDLPARISRSYDARMGR